MRAAALLVLLFLCSCADCSITEQGITIRGSSLLPLVAPGTQATLERDACSEPQRGDIIAYNYTGNEAPVAKIVKGVPGDRWRLEGCNIILNDAALTNSAGERYCIPDTRMLALYTRDYPTIPEGTYLIMGDDPRGSLDSERFGLVARQDLIGRIIIG